MMLGGVLGFYFNVLLRFICVHFMCMSVCLHVCICIMCVLDAPCDQKRGLDPLGLELWRLSHSFWERNESSEKAESAFNFRAIAPASS